MSISSKKERERYVCAAFLSLLNYFSLPSPQFFHLEFLLSPASPQKVGLFLLCPALTFHIGHQVFLFSQTYVGSPMAAPPEKPPPFFFPSFIVMRF